MSDVRLGTDRLVLRDHTLDDFCAYRRFWAEQACDVPGGPPRTAEEVWYRLVFLIGHWRVFRYGLFLAIDPTSNEIIGEIGFRRMERSSAPLTSEREGGWNLGRAHRSQGLASEAMICARDWMDTHHPGRQSCFIDVENTASIRLAKVLGFEAVSEHEYNSSKVTLFERPAPQQCGAPPAI
ncbi:GNAT family N-acetyltransferase [Altererythrobacter soli]|uniref:GNAT family N-acetyltransferase n=1 Tax=Croceibacterium soli TaxID=1739690 RepID=A0A6I4USZ9_9SPHN|nr:GNAT family N-acetyltransferase [Croceibacterium soli]MXP40647.1 GNAT family N-acetyltransferase [Croceibacterium soli]